MTGYFGTDYDAYVKYCSALHQKWLEAELHQVLPRTRPQALPPGVAVEFLREMKSLRVLSYKNLTQAVADF